MSTTTTLVPLLEQAREFLRQAKAENTRRAYRSDWAHFDVWCSGQGMSALPAAEKTLALYFTELAATHKVSTLQRRLASISQAHLTAGFESPSRGAIVRNLLAGIRRAKGTRPDVKTPILTEDLRLMIQAIPDTLAGSRDRALLLIGFVGAFRRSELVALDFEDLEFQREGVVVTVRRSKTDPEGQGRRLGIPLGSGKTCPVRALEKWLEVAHIETGAVFRAIDRHDHIRDARLSDRSVAGIVKRWTETAGLDPGKYAGHSLRAGLATSAARAGASERAIMNQTGHRSVQMVRRYIREGEVFGGENVATIVGL